jgi:transposase
MGKRKRRVFTAEQRAEAVKIALGSSKPVAHVAKDLDLSVTVLRNWMRQAKVDEVADSNGPPTTEERAELARLRREHKQLELENAFLKNHPGAAGHSLLDQKLFLV